MTKVKQVTALIQAAGAGTRIDQSCRKFYKVCGTAMVEHVIDAVQEMHVSKTVIVIGHGAEQENALLTEMFNLCCSVNNSVPGMRSCNL